MKIYISSEVLAKYTNLSIGILMAKVQVKKTDKYVEALKQDLPNSSGISTVKKYSTIDKHPTIASWRKTYEGFGVKPNKYLSAVESVVKRVIKDQPIWNISNI